MKTSWEVIGEGGGSAQGSISTDALTSIKKYVEEGEHPGDCISAVICNDFEGAFFSSDSDSFLVDLRDIARYILWNVNIECKGSVTRFSKWIRKFKCEK